MIQKRLRISLALVLALLTGLAFRLLYVQVFRGLAYAEIAEKQSVRKVKAESLRGSILDREGRILATTLDSQSVFIRPKEVRNQRELFKFLQSSLNVDTSSLHKKMTGGQEFIWLERKLNPEQARLVTEKKIPGLGVTSEQKRYYPNGPMACHLVGSVGLDNHGLAGLEQALDSFLTGKTVVVEQLRDGRGRRITMDAPKDGQDAAVAGQSVTLTIDRSLQFAAESEIKRGVEENRARSGMIILQNPRTGEILAMAAYPHFDPNEMCKGGLSKADAQRLSNPLTGKTFEPGSTFKLMTYAAALEERKASITDRLDCEKGKWKFMDVTITDHEPEGVLTLAQVMEKSSNVACAKIGLKVGKEVFYRYVRAFGFGGMTGLPLPGESGGLLKEPKQWSLVTLPIMAFGQGVSVTAMQMVSAYSAVANDGVLVEPMLIRSLNEFQNGRVSVRKFEPQEVRRVISKETAKTLKGILRGVVDRGTGGLARVEGYSVAGKTGTAQKVDPETKKYSKSDYVCSFIGFTPAENPQLVCLVVLDSPRKDVWASSTAAPVFSRVVSRAVRVLGIAPDQDLQLAKVVP